MSEPQRICDWERDYCAAGAKFLHFKVIKVSKFLCFLLFSTCQVPGAIFVRPLGGGVNDSLGAFGGGMAPCPPPPWIRVWKPMRYSESAQQKASGSIHGGKICDIKCKKGHPTIQRTTAQNQYGRYLKSCEGSEPYLCWISEKKNNCVCEWSATTLNQSGSDRQVLANVLLQKWTKN